MRLQHLALLASVAAGVAACGGDTGGTTTVQPPLAYVRYVHAMPDTGIVDVRVIDKVENLNMFQLPYRTVTPFQGVQAGSRHFKIFVATTDAQPDPAVVTQFMKDTLVNLEANTYYTLIESGFARTGSAPAQGLKVVVESAPASPTGSNYALRIFPAATYAGGVDVYFTTDTLAPTTAPIATNVTAAAATSYLTLPVASSTTTYYVQIYPTGAAPATIANRILPFPPDGLPPSQTQVSTGRWNAVLFPMGTAASGATSAAPGARIAGSVLTMYYFPPGVTNSQTQSITSTGPLKGVAYAGVGFGYDRRP